MASNSNEHDHARIREVVRDYLDKWEDWEKKNKKNATISPAELSALLLLAQRPFEQELDDHNYIGEIHEWVTKNQCGPLSWDEKELNDPVTKQRVYRVMIKLPNGIGKFPREGYGLAPGKKAHAYPVKKKAKQVAAKWALTWLKERPKSADAASDSSPSDSASEDDNAPDETVNKAPNPPSAPKDSNPKANRAAPTTENSPNRKKVKTGERETQMGAPLTPSGSNVFSGSYPPLREEAPPLRKPADGVPKQVDGLAKKLGFDAPKYAITCEADGSYSGHPVFQLDGRMPENLACVTGMESENEARAEMARIVFDWLCREYKSMDKDRADMLQEYSARRGQDPVGVDIDKMLHSLEDQQLT